VARIDAADFGVFRPWRVLTTMWVPPIPPRKSVVLDESVRAALLRDLRSPTLWVEKSEDVHYVGNINVFLGRECEVERHLRRAVGLRPGAANVSMFFVGDGAVDVYTFSVEACEPRWDVQLASAHRSVEVVRRIVRGEPVPPEDRLVLDLPHPLMHGCVNARITPPPKAESGRIVVAVTRGTTGRTAFVEFELETSRLETRCHEV
jgi:hypothetical protein